MKVRFNRAYIESAIDAAYRLKHDKPVYVYATAYGYVLDFKPPPFNNQNYAIIEQGKPVQHIEVHFGE